MLLNLNIKNIALIEQLQVEFSDGFHVLTGETGAGKSIIIDAVNFVLGERANKDLIKSGSEKASVEAAFNIEANAEVLQMIEELGIENDEENVLILTRELSSTGKSICRVNNTLVNLSALKSISNFLVDVHGQHEHQSLLKEETHIEFLDSFNHDLCPLKDSVLNLHKEIASIHKQLNSGFLSEQERLRRLDLLNYQIKEIASAELEPEEEVELDEQLRVLSNAQTIISALESSFSLLSDDENSSLTNINRALQQIQSIENLHREYAQISNRLQDVYYSLEDIASTISDLKNSFEYNPDLLANVEARLARIHLLKRKYGGSIFDILEFYKRIVKEYDELIQSDEKREQLQNELNQCEFEYKLQAELLMEARISTSELLKHALIEQLKDLGMDKSSFEVLIKPLSENQFTPDGVDKIEFLLSTNAGEPVKPLKRVVSGGELSRIMLAFKNLQMQGIPTVIFDEIDSGISGHIATVVGHKLLEISKRRQVLCVTHLPQIASMADVHYLVEKNETDGHTTSTLRLLNCEERVHEIARIMGATESDTLAIEHARELLQRTHILSNKTI
ncbi:MAG TPA: DNA repair protein RecN [Clostridia bacterium]|nr:DNA repair protein RecN [Clostridia bacterium]